MKFIIFGVLFVAAAQAAYTPLDADTQAKVAKAWAPIKADLPGKSSSIFYNYLKKFPANQDKFETLKGKPLDEVKETASFKTISGRIFSVFDNLVKNVGDDSAFKKVVLDMSGPHVSRPISKGAYNDLGAVVLEEMALDADRKF